MRARRAHLETHPDSSFGLPVADDELTIAHALRWSVGQYPDLGALTFGERTWTYAEVWDEVRSYAAALVDLGVGKGTRVGIMMGTRPEFAFLLYANALVGGVSVLLSTFSTPAEARWILEHSDASMLFGQTWIRGRELRSELVEEIPGLGAADGRLRDASVPYLERVFWLPTAPETTDDDRRSWDDALTPSRPVSAELLDARLAEVQPDDDALLLYTSGSTGTPKAVLHMHRSPTIQGLRMADCLAIGPDDVAWTSFPTFWTAGLVTALFGPFTVGARTVLQETYEPAEALRIIERERVSSIRQTAHDELRLVNEHEKLQTDLSSVEIGVISSALRDLTDMEGEVCEICGWGMSETFTLFTMTPFDAEIDVRRDTNGKVGIGDRIRISDPETGDEVELGGVGEITIAGPTLFRGYYKQTPLLPLDAAGFFRTGDTGFIDGEGRLVYTGRLDRLIKSGGANVSPIEIEERLLGWGRTGPCSVLGIPHPSMGQAVVLVVVRKEGEDVSADDVMEFLRGEFSSYKLPRRVFFLSSDEVPMTSSAKVLIGPLRDLVIERLIAEDDDEVWKQYLSEA